MLGLQLFASLSDLLDAFEVVHHILNLRVWLDLAFADDLIMIIEVADVLLEGLDDALGHLNRQVNHKGPTEVPPCLHQVICAEMVVLVWAHVVPAERGLDRVDGWTLQFVEESHASGGFFRFLISKSGVAIDEERTDIRHNKRMQPRIFRLPRYITAVHEDVLPTAVSMEVAEDLQLSFF